MVKLREVNSIYLGSSLSFWREKFYCICDFREKNNMYLSLRYPDNLIFRHRPFWIFFTYREKKKCSNNDPPLLFGTNLKLILTIFCKTRWLCCQNLYSDLHLGEFNVPTTQRMLFKRGWSLDKLTCWHTRKCGDHRHKSHKVTLYW